MKDMDNIFIIGTRAQLIKVAPIIFKFEQEDKNLILLLTGQHKDTMSDLLDEFKIITKPKNLLIANEKSTVAQLLLWTPQILFKLISFLSKKNPSRIFIHGDTLTTLISAISSRITKHTVIHLESGLSSKKLINPFPEEIIRRAVFKLTDIAFCPSEKDVSNMKKFKKTQIINTHGNTIINSLNQLKIEKQIVKKNTLLFSIHRFQNISSKIQLKTIVDMIIDLSNSHIIYFVLHPATINKLNKYNLMINLDKISNIHLIKRMTYKRFLNLALSCETVITDGGSNQEELAYFGHPTIILRKHTERNDGIGRNAILIEDPNQVINFIRQKKNFALNHNQLSNTHSPTDIIYNHFFD